MGREVGDLVVSLADTGQNVVVEAKTEGYPTKKIKAEMQEALQNRDAAYGVFVTDRIANLPRTKTGWFHEFPEQNTVVVALSEEDEDEIEPGYLRIAFNWARMRAVQNYASVGSDFDPDTIRSEVAEIKEEIGRFSTVRGQCTEIRKSRTKIEETLNAIKQDIADSFARAQRRIRRLNLRSLPVHHHVLYAIIREAGEISAWTLHARYDEIADVCYRGTGPHSFHQLFGR